MKTTLKFDTLVEAIYYLRDKGMSSHEAFIYAYHNAVRITRYSGYELDERQLSAKLS